MVDHTTANFNQGPTIVMVSSVDKGLFVAGSMQSYPVRMLVDTGSNVTIMKTEVFKKISNISEIEVTEVNSTLVTATGESSPFYGKADLLIEIGNHKMQHSVLLADIKNDVILGVDFMEKHKCDVLLSKNCLSINGHKVQCFQISDLNVPTCCRIAIDQQVTVPPESEMIVQGRPIDTLSKGKNCVLETAPSFNEKSGLLVAKALVDPCKGLVPIRVINLSEQPQIIHKHTVAAVSEPIDEDMVFEPENVRNITISETKSHQKCDNKLPDHLVNLFNKSSENLDIEQTEKLKLLLEKHQHSFSKSSTDIGCTSLVEHTINTGNVPPIKQRPRRVPLAKMKEAEAEIKDMAERNIIEPCSGPWCSPTVLVRKKDNSIRFCVDYRKLNDITIKDSHPLPRIDDTLDALSGSQWFSTLDLKSGYWQVKMAEKDKPKTAFSIQGGGFWQFNVMSFGLCNAPATFERLMERVLSGLSWKTCLVYLDDIIVFAKSFEEQLERLDEVFTRLHEAGLKLSPKKCTLFQEDVDFLGHNVSRNGISTDPKKVAAVKEWPVPKNVKDVRSFLGICSYYRRFVRNFADIAKPLHKQTEKGCSFTWTESCQKAFETLKTALTTAPILGYPTAEGSFIVDTDASNEGMGAVLSQVQGDTEKVISYFSKTFSKPEKKYCVTRRELLAVVASIKHFHHYLYGRRFLVRSDHGALRWLLNFKNPEGQIARWFEVLATYDFSIEHRAGRLHSNADALSRRPCHDKNCGHCIRAETKEQLQRGETTQTQKCNTVEVSQSDTPIKEVELESNENKAHVGESSPKILTMLTSHDSMINPSLVEFVTSDFEGSISSDTHPREAVSGEISQQNSGDVISQEPNLCCTGSCPDSLHIPPDMLLDSTHEIAPFHNDLCDVHACTRQSSKLQKVDIKDDQTPGSSKLTTQSMVTDTTGSCPEDLRESQLSDPDISIVYQWKKENERPPWSSIYSYSEAVKFYWSRWDSLHLRDEILYRKWETDDGKSCIWQVVLPLKHRPFVLKQLHDSCTGGHLGIKKTVSKVRQRFFWCGLRRDVTLWCRMCDSCAAGKRRGKVPHATLQKYGAGAPMERIAVDILGPLPRSKKGNKYLLVVGDYFTKWVDAFPVPNEEAHTIAKKLVERVFSVFGVPMQLHTDRGTNFESHLFKEMCQIMGIDKTRTTAYRPQSDGMIERANQTIENMLRNFVSNNQTDWDEYIPMLMMAYRSSEHEATGFSPCTLMLGREISLPVDLCYGSPMKENYTNHTSEYTRNLLNHLLKVHEVARQNLNLSHTRMKKQYDSKSKQSTHCRGDLVWLYNPARHVGKCQKLQNLWHGPYTVTEVLNDVIYRIQETPQSKPKVVHHDHLKPYQGNTAKHWLK